MTDWHEVGQTFGGNRALRAAVLIAGLALVVSLGSVVFAKRSVDEARAMRAIESQRRHAERSPSLDGQVEEMNQGQWHRLWLNLKTSEPLDSVRADILDEPDVWFADGQTGVQPGVGRTRTAIWGGLSVGKREAAWRIAIGKAAPHSMPLLHDLLHRRLSKSRITRVHQTGAGPEWPVLLTVDLPSTYDVANSVW